MHKVPFVAFILLALFGCNPAHATTKGLSQIVTPDLEPPGDVSISAQVQSERIGNPYEAPLEIGLVKWAEIAVFKGFKPNELIFGTELGLLQKEPWLLSIGAINWSPHSHVDPSHSSRQVTTPSITNSSSARFGPAPVRKPFSAGPTTSTKPGEHSSISKADAVTPSPPGLLVT